MPNVLAVLHDDIIWNEADNFPYADNNPYIGPQAVHIWTMNNGKAIRFQQHIDTLNTARTTGTV
ncbi:hypothetical protein [Thalassotalea profundi]|uniref:Uncharacterized protein n=1 Tax=Thalassotalea profundi TaxID=2036687 RepID=A0ABQ3J3N8_9GAMM|nr:hypothetical protein [Thalassotalea profundi]GHF01450.1 hypothetical protein GCM10011501_33700 [Thalassotalea profundi]